MAPVEHTDLKRAGLVYKGGPTPRAELMKLAHMIADHEQGDDVSVRRLQRALGLRDSGYDRTASSIHMIGERR